MNFSIGAIGYNHSHDKDFVQNHPDGIGCYLLLLIKTPALFELNHKKFEVKANSFILISPSVPCLYKAVSETYTDDWMFFGLDEHQKEFLDQLKIPFDEPFFLGNVEEISQIIHILAFEHYSSDLYHSEIEENYLQVFFYKLSRMIQTNVVPGKELFALKNDKLIYLRTKIYAEPTFFQNVDAMADFVNLSRSGFQHLYKNTFGINVKTDLINARIEYCKNLLEKMPFTVSEIAMKAGYKSEYSFMRQFKEKTGLTPTEYRKKVAR